jgi:hypothetical protein
MSPDYRRVLSTSLFVAGLLGCDSTGDAPATPSTASGPVCHADDSSLGHTPLRRLTRFEYGRTLADLSGVDPVTTADLPPDEKSLGFDDIAEAHSISALHVSKYLEVADRVAEALVSDQDRLRAFASCDPVADAACVEPFVRAVGRRVFRRSPSEDEVAALLALHVATMEPSPREGVTAVVSALLQAPQFLYRVETGAGVDFGPVLASRLSYLLTASAPDDELLLAAENGELSDDAALLAQAERLLSTPRAAEAFGHFMSQWWNLDQLDTLEKDRSLYRTWTDALPAAFAAETRHFIEAAWAEGPTLATFFAAPHTYADAELADFYGFEPASARGFQRVTPRSGRASGLFTQGAFLATHAKGNQTSPVLRGKFIRERLFCTTPPPPPPDIVVRPPVVDPRSSTRERFAAHTVEPRCAVCHTLMDPIGFSFEHYDATGRYRDTDASKPVDATGVLSRTDVDRTLDGVPSLAAALLESAQVRTCVATQWFRYAFGRQESAGDGDACAIASLSAALATHRGDLRAAMRATITSPLFREQRPQESSP